MKALTNFVRENPIKTTSSMIALVVSLVGTVILVDDRYAHAADFNKQMTVLSSQLEINRLTSEVSQLQSRKSSLEDKIYDAVDTKKKSPNFDRYRNELISINEQLDKKNDLIDKLRTGK